MTDAGNATSVIRENVGYITFSHPRGNSLPGTLLRSIAACVDGLGQSPECRVVVLQSEGEKVFCGGASFDELLAVQNIEQSKHFFSGFAVLILAMRRCPKFIVCRVQGKTVGGGVGVVAAADYAFATQTASVRLSELAIGFGPFIIGPAVQRKLGLAAFTELAIDADWRDAHWAKAHGLFAEIFPEVSDLDARITAFTKKLSQFNPDAMAKLKAILWEGTEHWSDLIPQRVKTTSELALTPFVKNAVTLSGKRTN